jgi:hypothetical protein
VGSILFEGSIDMRLFESIYFAYVMMGLSIDSWFYMRFYMKRELTDCPGDLSSNFALSAFFPPAAQPYVQPISKTLHYWAVVIGIIPSVSLNASRTGTMLDKTTTYEKQR